MVHLKKILIKHNNNNNNKNDIFLEIKRLKKNTCRNLF